MRETQRLGRLFPASSSRRVHVGVGAVPLDVLNTCPLLCPTQMTSALPGATAIVAMLSGLFSFMCELGGSSGGCVSPGIGGLMLGPHGGSCLHVVRAPELASGGEHPVGVVGIEHEVGDEVGVQPAGVGDAARDRRERGQPPLLLRRMARHCVSPYMKLASVGSAAQKPPSPPMTTSRPRCSPCSARCRCPERRRARRPSGETAAP